MSHLFVFWQFSLWKNSSLDPSDVKTVQLHTSCVVKIVSPSPHDTQYCCCSVLPTTWLHLLGVPGSTWSDDWNENQLQDMRTSIEDWERPLYCVIVIHGFMSVLDPARSNVGRTSCLRSYFSILLINLKFIHFYTFTLKCSSPQRSV